MPRTRASKPSTKDVTESICEDKTPALPPPDSNPPKLFILPKNRSKDARIVTLNDPVTKQSTRYFFCPEKGLHQFTQVAAPKSQPRSWLITSTEPSPSKADTIAGADTDKEEQVPKSSEATSDEAYICKSQDLFVATPFDMLFQLLPIISPSGTKNKQTMFLTLDDHLEMAQQSGQPLLQLLRTIECRQVLQSRLSAICDTVEAGDQSMYRLSQEKLAKELYAKAAKLVAKGLPPSLEDRFVARVLHVPVFAASRTVQSSQTLDPNSAAVITEDDSQTSLDSIAAITDSTTSQQTGKTEATSLTSSTETLDIAATTSAPVPPEILNLLRIRTALDFILRSYICQDLHAPIRSTIHSVVDTDFSPLDDYMKQIEASKAEVQALRAISDNITRKRYLDDEEEDSARAEKKRKKEEEDKKEKAKPRSIKELGKVNTAGMKKLSSFFTKKPAVKS